MLRMTASIAAANRLVLVGPARGARGRDSATIRRYRLARLRVEGRAHADAVRGSAKVTEARHEHLKRVYD
jgi:hypothetical protein